MELTDIEAEAERDADIERHLSIGGARVLFGGVGLAVVFWWVIADLQDQDRAVGTEGAWIVQLVIGLAGLWLFILGVRSLAAAWQGRRAATRADRARLWLTVNGTAITGTVAGVEHSGEVAELVVIYDDPESGLRHTFRRRITQPVKIRSGEHLQVTVDPLLHRYEVLLP